MSEREEDERKVLRVVCAFVLMSTLASILIAEAVGWNPLDVYFAEGGIELVLALLVAILAGVMTLPTLWYYIRTRLF